MSLLKDKIELDVQLAELRTQQALGRFPIVLRWLLILCVLAIIPAYYVAKSLSYNYWTKNLSQYLIAAKTSFSNPKPPRIGNVLVTSSGGGNYSALVPINNDNVDLSLPQADYQLTFFDAAGHQLYQETNSTFLLPNDQKYLVVPHFNSQQSVKSANFSWLGSLHWEKRISIPKVSIQTSIPDTYNQFLPPAFAAQGNYFNNSPYQLGQVRLTFLIYDGSGKIVGTSRRDDFTIAPFERRSYTQLWPNLYGDPSYTVKVSAETDTLNAHNLTLPPTPTTPASDLSHPATGQNN